MRGQFNRWVLFSGLFGALTLSACAGAGEAPPPADPPTVDPTQCLKIAEENVDFGPVAASCEYHDRAVTVLNRCGIPVLFTAADSPELASAFRLIVPAKAIEVPAHGWSQFHLRFMPTTLGSFSGSVRVHSAQQDLTVSVMGQSVDGSKPAADEWRIPERVPLVDILFVIDNSPAMAGREESLRQNFDAILRYLRATSYDLHIAVTTTDNSATGEQGRFLPLDDSEPRVLTSDTPDLDSLFARRVMVGAAGLVESAGLETVRKALSPAMLESHNSGFLRANAFLYLVVVSASSDSSPDSFDSYYSSLMDVKGFRNASRMSFSAVVISAQDRAGLYQRMSEWCGGIFTSLDTSNWAKDLFKVSSYGEVRRNFYWFSSFPSDIAAIRVLINGVEFPARQGNITNWWYDSPSNSVVFNTIAQPESGTLLRIEYTVGCVPSE